MDPRVVTIPRELYLFLLGEGPLDGAWFGENPVPRAADGAFWWRAMLRSYGNRPAAVADADDDLIERLRAQTVIRKGEPLFVDLGDGRGPQEMYSGDIIQRRNPDGPEAADLIEQLRAASAMSASGQDPQGLEAKPASATAKPGRPRSIAMTSEAQPGQEQRMDVKCPKCGTIVGSVSPADSGGPGAPGIPHSCDHPTARNAVGTVPEFGLAGGGGGGRASNVAYDPSIPAGAGPTADLGDDGELASQIADAFNLARAAALSSGWSDKVVELRATEQRVSDRLILYREALEVLLLVKDAVDYRGDACHPAEMVGAVLDKCILERIDAVLSSDRKVAGGSGSA